ncbi:hypothetical protein [Marasmitruncus massiliensis]|uniref:hypothetical protein n=1 Tax=Marasmitruncus massiliensis TaxID=1944642 RepID=UPI000C7A4C8B|nr:hypothetical protein [Marasmitruncus massiliensis]
MKKVLSAVLAGAMTVAMAVPAFAASNVTTTVYNSDGDSIVGSSSDVFDTTPSVPFLTGSSGTISYGIDGVVPGITMYIPLGSTMSDAVVNGTAGTTEPTDANGYYEAGADAAFTAALTTVAADDKTEAEAAIGAGNKLADWTAVNAETGDVYYSDSNSNLTLVPDNTAATAPVGSVNFYIEAGKTEYDNALAAEVANHETDALAETSVSTLKITAGTPWQSADAKFYYSTTTKTMVAYSYSAGSAASYDVSLDSLTNTDYFKFDVDKNDGSKYVSKVEVLDDKKMSNLNQRTAFLKITLADSTTTSDLKSSGKITFKAKGDSASYTGSKEVTNGDAWTSGETFTINYTFWINNVKTGNDSNVDTGDRVYFDPDDNEDNTLVWGDDRAALYFEANDDASKFYARLQTKSDSEIYSTYGDPVNADLWFFDFVGNPTVPATSRATLTLGIPWDEDDDYTPNPEDCFIYEKDADGNLIDVTSQFTYDEDNDGTTEIPGWSIKTRTLGTYVISDTELDLDVIDDVDEEPVDDDTDTTVDTGKEIPNTGSSDMVGVAVVAAVVSLAAAGAVAFKKASK